MTEYRPSGKRYMPGNHKRDSYMVEVRGGLYASSSDLAHAEAIIRERDAEIERLRGERAWRPIETAPKDGTLLLGWWAKGLRGKGLPFILIWSNWLDGSEDGVMCWMDFQRAWPCEPSHWMPIPQFTQPPQETADAD